jgi:hypothetical protein
LRIVRAKSYQNLISTNKQDVLVHTCNPIYTGDRGRRTLVQDQPEQKIETLSEK